MEIGQSVFLGCNRLTSINVADDNQNYSSEDGILFDKEKTILYTYPSLKQESEYEIPNTVTEIEENAFNQCIYLHSVVIPNSVTDIDDNAFSNIRNINYICVENPNPDDIFLGKNVFYSFDKNKCILYVPKGSKELYEEADQWKDFANIVESVRINDSKPYTNSSDIEEVTVFYARNFETDACQALYVPFSMKYEDWADKADVAYINNVHQWDDDNDGMIDRTVLEFITKKNGSIEANKPYVIKPKQTGEITFTSENTTLYAAPETDGYVDCRSTTTEYTLYGTYQEKTDMYANGYYAMVNGGFRQAESASVKLSPFRTYLKIESRTGAGTVQQAKRINIMVDGVMDNDATGIEEITQDPSLETQNIYSLSGQKVNSNYKGIAIKNGKKYIIK